MFPLEAGADAPGNAVLFDGLLADEKGAPREVPRAVAIYERDGGILWKHYDLDTGRNETRRARDLVLSWIATVGNYDYGFNWIFHQDGTLEMDIILTGIMQTKGVSGRAGVSDGRASVSDGRAGVSEMTDHHGHLVMKDVSATHHQHFFNFRLDMDVDGTDGNSVAELNTQGLPLGPDNPFGNAFATEERVFHTELEARRLCNMPTGRKWKIFNPSVTNGLGQPVGYLLVPGDTAMPFADQNGSSIRRRAGFLDAHFWVTPYDPSQMNAAGYYINQSKGGEGLPKWTSANRPVQDRDIVIWYTMGTTHIPRPEEWPVMNSHHLGFKLIPCGFFTRNPAMDLPAKP
jgi:primary-amine oxidase